MPRADLAQDLGLLRIADDVDQSDAVLEADPVEHLSEIGCGRGMHQGFVALAPHRFGHAERRQRIDEAGGAFRGGDPLRQHQAICRPDRAVLRIHRTADHRHGLAHQRPGRIGRSGLDDHAGPLIADRHRFIEPPGHRLHRGFRNGCGDHRGVFRTGRLGRCHVGSTNQEAEVGRIDGRGLDADDDDILCRFGRRYIGERNFEFAALLDQRTQLKSGRVIFSSHVALPYGPILPGMGCLKVSLRPDLRARLSMSTACPRRRTWRACPASRNRAAAPGRNWDRRRASVPRPSASSGYT